MNDAAEPTSAIDATILIVDDLAANRNVLREALEPQGYEVLLAPDGKTALRVAARARPDVILLDVMMPGLNGFETCRQLKKQDATRAIPVLFITALDETKSMVEGFQAGGVDYIAKPFQTEEVLIRVKTHLDNARLTRIVVEKNQELEAANARLRQEIVRRQQAEASLEKADERLSLISRLEADRWGIPALVGRSPTLAHIIDQVRRLQALPKVSVLITGESGTGKELVARAIHFGSPRAHGPFLPVNCSAIPHDLAESLFFGYAKGAFSGATADKKGYFENAEGGTVFLDEIGDMAPLLQAKLLRALEAGRILPLGAAQEKPVDVRVIAATNADLQSEIAAGQFREDLYYRLARFVAEVAPLRERREDIGLLADHFLGTLSTEMSMRKPELRPETRAILEAHDYPGNVRELKNLIERALIESGGGDLWPEHLQFAFRPLSLVGSAAPPGDPPALPQEAAQPLGSGHLARRSSEDEEARIIGYTKQHGTISNAECRQLLSVGIHRAWYLLSKLHRRGELVQDSSRRWTQYRLP